MKTRNFCRAVSLALSLLGVNTLAQAGSIYTGTDDKGRQSFSDRPCPCPADAKQSKAKQSKAAKSLLKQQAKTSLRENHNAKPLAAMAVLSIALGVLKKAG